MGEGVLAQIWKSHIIVVFRTKGGGGEAIWKNSQFDQVFGSLLMLYGSKVLKQISKRIKICKVSNYPPP